MIILKKYTALTNSQDDTDLFLSQQRKELEGSKVDALKKTESGRLVFERNAFITALGELIRQALTLGAQQGGRRYNTLIPESKEDSTLASELKSTKAQLATLQQTLKELQENPDVFDQKTIQEKERLLKEAQEALKKSEESKAALQKDIELAQKQVDEVNGKYSQIKDQLAKQQQEMQGLTAEYSKQRMQLESNAQRSRAIVEREAAIEKEKGLLKQGMNPLQGKTDSESQQKLAQLQESYTKLREETSRLAKEKEALALANKTAEAEKRKLKETLQQQDQSQKALEKQLMGLRSERIKAEDVLSQKQGDQFTAALDSSQALVQGVTLSLLGGDSKLSGKEQLSVKQKEIDDLKAASQEKLRGLQQKLGAYTAQIEEMTDQAKAYEGFNQQQKALEQQLDALKKERAELEAKAKKVPPLEQEVSELRRKLEQAKTDNNTTLETTLAQTLKVKEQELESVSREAAKAKEALKVNNQKAEAVQKEQAALDQAVDGKGLTEYHQQVKELAATQAEIVKTTAQLVTADQVSQALVEASKSEEGRSKQTEVLESAKAGVLKQKEALVTLLTSSLDSKLDETAKQTVIAKATQGFDDQLKALEEKYRGQVNQLKVLLIKKGERIAELTALVTELQEQLAGKQVMAQAFTQQSLGGLGVEPSVSIESSGGLDMNALSAQLLNGFMRALGQ